MFEDSVDKPSEKEMASALEKIPDLDLAQLKFSLTLPENSGNMNLKQQLLDSIIKNNMAPWYEKICKEFSWDIDKELLENMKNENVKELKNLDDAINEIKELSSDFDIRQAQLKKAQYYCLIGDEKNAIIDLEDILKNTVPAGPRIKILFHLLRLCLFFRNYKMIPTYLDKADALEDDLEWDLKNRLRVYKGFCYMSIRQFEDAAKHLLSATSTFTSYELMSFNTFVKYAVWCGMVSLPRNELKETVIHSSDIKTVVFVNKKLGDYVNSLYNCQWAEFFLNLAETELQLKENMFMNPHYRHYVHIMKAKAYSQFLESYLSVSLEHMAKSFGVTPEYIDAEMTNYIITGKLSCQIDKVDGKIVTKRANRQSEAFLTLIKKGDVLLNRIDNLFRICDL